VDRESVNPEVRSGDPFVAGNHHRHCCNDGLVSIGVMTEDEDGNEVEEVYILPCRRCSEEGPSLLSPPEEGSR
jgi:hypothetical protein